MYLLWGAAVCEGVDAGNRLRWRIVACASIFALLLVASPTQANSSPTGEVLLVVDGAINPGGAYADSAEDQCKALGFDMAMLKAMPQHEVATTTPWDEGLRRFSGVRISDLFEAVGAESSTFLARGVDDYQAEFSGVDVDKYPVIVALEEDGAPISVRNLGPLRIIFPFDDHPELLTNNNKAIAVWQLIHMTVRK